MGGSVNGYGDKEGNGDGNNMGNGFGEEGVGRLMTATMAMGMGTAQRTRTAKQSKYKRICG